MSQAIKIIERACAKLGVKAAGEPLTAMEATDALDTLNDIISEWSAEEILTGVDTVYTVTDQLKEPPHVTGALVSALAVALAPEYRDTMPVGLVNEARGSKDTMLRVRGALRQVPLPSTVPKGSGNYNTFFPGTRKRNF